MKALNRMGLVPKCMLFILVISWTFWLLFSINQLSPYEDTEVLSNKYQSLSKAQSQISHDLQALKSEVEQKAKQIQPYMEKLDKLKLQSSMKESNALSISYILASTSLSFDMLPSINRLIPKSASIPYEVLIVSESESTTTEEITLFLENFVPIRVIKAAANTNIYSTAATYAYGKYLTFLPNNIDFGYKENSMNFERMATVLESNQEIGALGSTLVYTQDKVNYYVQSIGLYGTVDKENFDEISFDIFHKWKGVHLSDSRVDSSLFLNLQDPQRISHKRDFVGISRNGMVVSKQLFLEVGGFETFGVSKSLLKFSNDERNLQDADLSLKLKKRGKSVFVTDNILSIFEPSVKQVEDPYFNLRQNEGGDVSKMKEKFAKKWEEELSQMEIPWELSLNVLWDLYCSCTGFNIEAINFLVPLETQRSVRVGAVAGKDCFCKGFPDYIHDSLERIRTTDFDQVDVFVSHKPPNKYPKFPYNGLVTIPTRPKYVIGRSMSESDPISQEWVFNCNNMVDEVWVPSYFHVDVFSRAGVNKSKIFRIPEATDVHLWNPDVTSRLPVPAIQEGYYNFFSSFKWEDRKGWQFLLKAYFQEFSKNDKVALFIQTYLPSSPDPHNPQKILSIIRKYADQIQVNWENTPRIHVLAQELPSRDMPRLYKNFDAFVLSTRGEGWGLPIVEAMAMEMPVIATNWSGTADFLTDENSYPLEIEGLEPTSDGTGKWAKPSVGHLKKLMRQVFENREEAKRKGQKARQDVVRLYSQEKVAEIVMSRLREIDKKLNS